MGVLDAALGPLRWRKEGPLREYVGRRGEVVRYRMLIGPCTVCGCKEGTGRRKNHTHHVTYEPVQTVVLCPECHDRMTSVNAVVGWKQRAPLSNELRVFLWEWFRQTKYFEGKRRLAGGVGARLLDLYKSGRGHVTDEEVFVGRRRSTQKSGQRG